MSDLDGLMQTAQRAATTAGAILLDLRGRITAREKGPADLVTEADLAAQAAIRQILCAADPTILFVGEEDTPAERATFAATQTAHAACWIVDPLDGTANYVHGLDNYAVSIALCQGPEIVLGVVYDPVRSQMFTARAQGGAYLNGQRLQASGVTRLDAALVAASFAARVPPNSPEVTRFVQVLHQCQAIRRLGSAALNLCYVAAGKLDAYWATSVKSWDIAAGVLLVREAGGVITSIDGTPFDLQRPLLVSAATPTLHAEMLATLRIVDSRHPL